MRGSRLIFANDIIHPNKIKRKPWLRESKLGADGTNWGND